MRQKLHGPRSLAWRAAIAALANTAMATGLYPLVPHAGLALSRWRGDKLALPGQVRAALREWATAVALSAARPLGFLPLPGDRGRGPRPIIVVHGYAMNRANFTVLACRLARAGLGPVLGFEYWSLGKTGTAAKRLADYVEAVRAATEADEVDVIGHSMGGVVGRYFVSLLGGDGIVKNLVTLGTPHAGTDVSAIGIGRPAKELLLGSSLMQRLEARGRPERTRMTVIWSRADALVPGSRHARVVGADELVFDDLGHLSLLCDRRVADEIVARLRT